MSPASRIRRLIAVTLSGSLGLVGLAACEPPAPPAGPPTRAMVFPLASAVKYSDTWGAARSGGRSHEGQDLMAPKGTLAVAAASGTVTFLRHDSAGLSGNMLRITDADGWQYVYIHLNNDHPGTDDAANVYEQAFVDGIRQGQHVVAGEPIGFVGDSGNAENTGAHLHFELRDPSGAAVNAYSSLRAAPVSVRSLPEILAAAPFGSVDSWGPTDPGTIRVTGWALDRAVDAAVPVSIYVDGNPKVTRTAAAERPDVATAFAGYGSRHGYDISLAGLVAGSHRVCVVLHNAGAGGGSIRLACTDLVVA